MLFITALYIFFGFYTCFAWNLGEDALPLITSSLPANNPWVYTIEVLFCLNLILSYPLVIFPANMVIESYLYKGWPKTKKRQWAKNVNRALMVVFTIIVALTVYN